MLEISQYLKNLGSNIYLSIIGILDYFIKVETLLQTIAYGVRNEGHQKFLSCNYYLKNANHLRQL